MPMRRGIGGILTAGLACVVLVAGETVAGPLVAADGAHARRRIGRQPEQFGQSNGGNGGRGGQPGCHW